MISEANLLINLQWVESLCKEDKLVKESLIVPFLEETSTFVTTTLRTTKEPTTPENYQLYTLACMYITSCYILDYPLALHTLRDLCLKCYTPERIRTTIYQVLVDDEDILVVDLKDVSCAGKRLADHGNTTCDLMMYQGQTMVCKKISHHRDGLPRHEAVVEIFVHRKLMHTMCQRVLKLHGLFIDDHHVHLFYEYLPIDLESVCGNMELVPTILVDILAGIEELHDENIAHRDLKLANIQCSRDNRAKLIDLGSSGYGAYRETIPICTMTHRSPEILKAEKDYTPDFIYDGKKLDIWSFGVLAMELLLGSTFQDIDDETTPKDMIHILRTQKRMLLRRLRTQVSNTAVFEMIRRCLSNNPLKRPPVADILPVFLRFLFQQRRHDLST
jgi:serine/threonine protein kinase